MEMPQSNNDSLNEHKMRVRKTRSNGDLESLSGSFTSAMDSLRNGLNDNITKDTKSEPVVLTKVQIVIYAILIFLNFFSYYHQFVGTISMGTVYYGWFNLSMQVILPLPAVVLSVILIISAISSISGRGFYKKTIE